MVLLPCPAPEGCRLAVATPCCARLLPVCTSQAVRRDEPGSREFLLGSRHSYALRSCCRLQGSAAAAGSRRRPAAQMQTLLQGDLTCILPRWLARLRSAASTSAGSSVKPVIWLQRLSAAWQASTHACTPADPLTSSLEVQPTLQAAAAPGQADALRRAHVVSCSGCVWTAAPPLFSSFVGQHLLATAQGAQQAVHVAAGPLIGALGGPAEGGGLQVSIPAPPATAISRAASARASPACAGASLAWWCYKGLAIGAATSGRSWQGQPAQRCTA